MKKTIIFIICIVLAVAILVCAGLLIANFIEFKKVAKLIENSEITLTVEESETFKRYFGIEKPDYLSVIECAEGQNETDSYFAVKAVILNKNTDNLISEISDTKGAELYEHKFTRTPVVVDFDQDLTWWNIEEGRRVVSYHLTLDDHESGSAAVTVVRIDGVNYVYMWYVDPAQIRK